MQLWKKSEWKRQLDGALPDGLKEKMKFKVKVEEKLVNLGVKAVKVGVTKGMKDGESRIPEKTK